MKIFQVISQFFNQNTTKMGLFNFVKNAGAKLFRRKDKKDPAEENKEKATAIEEAITNHGITVEYLRVNVDDDKVTISGVAANKAEREKVILIAGNVDGVASVDDQLELAEEEPTPRSVEVVEKPEIAETVFYTVEKGDTLWKISSDHYGNGSKYPVIFEANKPMLEHPDRIYPGQMLRIPPLEEEVA